MIKIDDSATIEYFASLDANEICILIKWFMFMQEVDSEYESKVSVINEEDKLLLTKLETIYEKAKDS